MPQTDRLTGFVPDARIHALGDSVRVYVVGGAVRDALLGLPVNDRDWVVVGATPQQMEAAGFTPVGADFPVFLHPDTHEEYALARTERKTAAGYRGFSFHAAPDVTLEADLQRRDLTVNAMAMSSEGTLHDPWGGLADLQANTLRHVSPAFAEDPVRILRLARFAARFPAFEVHPDTLQFCADMVARGEVKALVAERVWQEVSRLLCASSPVRGWAVLQACGALPDLMASDAAALLASGQPMTLRGQPRAAQWTLPMRWAACLLAAHMQPDAARQLAVRWRVPADCAELAQLVLCHFSAWQSAADAQDVASVLAAADLYRRPDRFAHALDVLSAVAQEQGQPPRLPVTVWTQVAQVAGRLPVGELARAAQAAGESVPMAVGQARAQAIGQALAGLLKC